MTVLKTHHNAYDAHYHFVFTVKYRKTLITRDIERALVHLGQEIGYRYDFDIEQMGCDGNHIHMLVSFPPKQAGSDFARIFKSITAIHLFKQFPVLKQNLWGGEFWSDGFYMATVSERGNWRTVEKYVRNQGKTKDISSQLRLFT